jgi:hypothetical protein
MWRTFIRYQYEPLFRILINIHSITNKEKHKPYTNPSLAKLTIRK